MKAPTLVPYPPVRVIKEEHCHTTWKGLVKKSFFDTSIPISYLTKDMNFLLAESSPRGILGKPSTVSTM